MTVRAATRDFAAVFLLVALGIVAPLALLWALEGCEEPVPAMGAP